MRIRSSPLTVLKILNGTKRPATNMTKDEIHKHTMCKNEKCPGMNEDIQTGNGVHNDANTKTDGISQPPFLPPASLYRENHALLYFFCITVRDLQ